MITREQIEARLAKLQADLAQLEANHHATSGAIQDCEYWLRVLEEDKAVKDDGTSRNAD